MTTGDCDGFADRRDGIDRERAEIERRARHRHRRELVAAWDRAGLASGHVWSPCDVCGEVALQPRDGGRRCFITPRCPGTHRPPSGRPTPLQAFRRGIVTADDLRRHLPELNDTLRRLLAKIPTQEEPPS